MFEVLIHADWSIDPKRRWAAWARRQSDGWVVEDVALVGDVSRFLSGMFYLGRNKALLLGFDFPIGVPHRYGLKTGFLDFRTAFSAFGSGAWEAFFRVCDHAEEISQFRPFYPRVSRKGVSRSELVTGLDVQRFDELLRVCERRTTSSREACSLFWTLGANQVGKGALHGWQEILRPALEKGARLWPFDGPLASLQERPGLVLAETYPALVYAIVGAGFELSESKRKKPDREKKSKPIRDWGRKNNVEFSLSVGNAVDQGFAITAGGEDGFDALLGLLGMIEVVDGRRPEATEEHPLVVAWEGWMLGR